MYFLFLKCALCEIAFDANKLKEYFDFSLCINNQPFSIKDALCTKTMYFHSPLFPHVHKAHVLVMNEM